MGNHRFKPSNIIPTSFWLSHKSAAPKFPDARKPQRPNQCAKEQLTSKKALPAQTFDEMLLLSSSSRSIRTERLPLCPETENALPHLTLAQPRRPSVSNSPTTRNIHSKCCHRVRLKLKPKSPRINEVGTNTRARAKSSSPSSCSSSSLGSSTLKERRGLSESSVMTVVKSSANPETDFKESMVGMIVENNITDLDGLEELLVSYLLLNSDEFHEVIVSVFKEIVIGMYRKPKTCSL